MKPEELKAKREELREGIAEIILKSWGKSEKSIDTAYDITFYLHAQGVVIAVEGELPYDWYNDETDKLRIKQEFDKAGYKQTYPLKEE